MTRLRFVLLEHDHPHLHWDLMLEEADGLRTWRLPSPTFGPEEMEAEALPMHRKAYLDYEGPVSGGRGSVKQVLAGFYRHDGDWNAEEGTLALAGGEPGLALRWRRHDGEWISEDGPFDCGGEQEVGLRWRREGTRWFFRQEYIAL